MFSRYGEIRMVYERDCREICEILFVKLLTYNVFWFFCSLFFTPLKSVTSTTTQIMINQLEDSKRKSSA